MLNAAILVIGIFDVNDSIGLVVMGVFVFVAVFALVLDIVTGGLGFACFGKWRQIVQVVYLDRLVKTQLFFLLVDEVLKVQ